MFEMILIGLCLGAFGLIVPSASSIAAKWARVTPDRETDYEAGVRNPKKDWEQGAIAAEDAYEDGVKKSIARKAYGKGVRKTGTAGQQRKTIEKGLPRWGEGVRLAEADMAKAMEEVVRVLEGITLPKRYPKGDPRNIERVKVINNALHKMKIGG